MNSEANIGIIIESVVNETSRLCQCQLTAEQIQDAMLTCSNDSNAVTFRARYGMQCSHAQMIPMLLHSVPVWLEVKQTQVLQFWTKLQSGSWILAPPLPSKAWGYFSTRTVTFTSHLSLRTAASLPPYHYPHLHQPLRLYCYPHLHQQVQCLTSDNYCMASYINY